MTSGQADVFLTYCTNARLAALDTPAFKTIHLPPELAVRADYGLVLLKNAPPEAAEFAAFVMVTQGQKILAGLGFEPAPDQ